MLYSSIKIISFILSKIPVSLALFLGRVAGRLFYIFAFSKRRLAYANLKRALCEKYNQKEIKQILKKSFSNFTQNIIETLFLPRIDKAYIDKFVKIDGLHYIDDALKKKKGVIIAGTHFGSWEISSAACSLLGYNYNLIFKEQRNAILNDLLNKYRTQKGSKIVSRGFSIREIIKSLEKNEVVGLAMDQGQIEGSIFVEFFGEPVPIPTGTLRIALKTGATVIPAYIRRIKDAYLNLVFLEPLNLEGIDEKNLEIPLKQYNHIAENFITKFPDDYAWFYKRWKRSPVINCLLLSDGKAGHVSQLKGFLNIIRKSDYKIKEKFVEAHFKNKFKKSFLSFCALTSGFYCQGCLWCLRNCLAKESYQALVSSYADIIVSCGASSAGVSMVLKNETKAKLISIMRPGVFSVKRFDLVIAPKHDNLRESSNVIESDIALNPVDKNFLDEQKKLLMSRFSQLSNLSGYTLSLFLGGPNRNQAMEIADFRNLFISVKQLSQDSGLNLLITTSRRTPRDIENLTKNEFSGFANCKLLVLANEDNPKGAIGGILSLSDLIIVTSDSISMVSEALSSGKPVAVFRLKGLSGTKHEMFLNNLKAKEYIELVEGNNISGPLQALIKNNNLKLIDNDLSVLEQGIIKFIS